MSTCLSRSNFLLCWLIGARPSGFLGMIHTQSQSPTSLFQSPDDRENHNRMSEIHGVYVILAANRMIH